MSEAQFSRWSLSGVEGLRALGDQLVSEDPLHFRTEGRRWAFSDIYVTDASQTAVTTRPAPFDLLQQHYISVTFVRNGHYELFDADRRFVFRAGDAGYMRGWNQVSAINPVASRVAMVSIHEDRLAEHGVHVTDRIGAFHAKTRLTGPSLSFILALMDDASVGGGPGEVSPTGPTAAVLAQLMAGLFIENASVLRSALVDAGISGESPRTDSLTVASPLLTRADALIMTHAPDANFSPTELARALNVSLRHLQRVFSQRGSSPAEAIRACRLDIALDALRQVPVTPRSVSAIAALSGFSSVKELRFALRLNYGVTPREFLAGQTG